MKVFARRGGPKKKGVQRHRPVVRHFLLVSRTGRTDGRFASLREAGRLDVVHQCAVAALFLSHGHRRDAVFTACLGGPPRPPVRVTVDGATLRDVRTDERTWESVLRTVLSGRPHPGIAVSRESLQDVVRPLEDVFVLHEKGEPIETIPIESNPTFVLGDQVGLPKRDESFVLRHGRKVSLGRRHSYLAASCVTALNYVLDRREDAANAARAGI